MYETNECSHKSGVENHRYHNYRLLFSLNIWFTVDCHAVKERLLPLFLRITKKNLLYPVLTFKLKNYAFN